MKPFRLTAAVLATSLTLGAGVAVQASSISPTSQFFGDIDAATTTSVTFGGSGIPTGRTAYSIFTDGNDTLLLGLTAHQRYSNPPLTDDGAGTFTATPGANDGTPGNPGTQSTWNFAWFAEATGQRTLADWDVKLLFDLDPGKDTPSSEMGMWDLATTLLAFSLPLDLFQSTQNATFGFLGTDDANIGLTAPSFTAFSPFAAGEYTFALTSTGGTVAMNVNVIPLPAAGWLLLGGLGALGAVARRKRRKAA